MQKGAAETVLNETAVQLRDAQTQLQEARLHAEKADSQHNLTQAKAAARQHELEGQLSHQEQQNRELQVKFNAALKELQSLRAVLDEELGEMRFTRRELGEADADAAQLEAELATQQEANRVLAGRLVDVQTLQAQLAAAQAEILALRDELHLREQEIHELWEQISEASDLGLQASPAAAAEASQHGSQRAQQEAAAAALGGSPGQSGVSDSWAGPLEPIAEPEQDSLMSESSRESDVSEASIGSQAVHSVSAGSSPDSSSAGQSVGALHPYRLVSTRHQSLAPHVLVVTPLLQLPRHRVGQAVRPVRASIPRSTQL
ncbi:hypothetical protein WJX72_011970 [[Myrmecia] bisecta]|uniref:Uncharacterized protein n=1 Tax=[Myrmecia] bisecta TaxID=41462 RepID=A0AAW1Q1W2_9CHLO